MKNYFFITKLENFMFPASSDVWNSRFKMLFCLHLSLIGACAVFPQCISTESISANVVAIVGLCCVWVALIVI